MSSINPWFITDLVEGEGSFYVIKDNRKITTFNTALRIEMLDRDYALLLKIQSFFNCGYIIFNQSINTRIYTV